MKSLKKFFFSFLNFIKKIIFLKKKKIKITQKMIFTHCGKF